MAHSLDHQIVDYARNLIADPEHWTQWHYAETKRGKEVEPESRHAYRFCAVGALQRAVHDLAGGEVASHGLVGDQLQRRIECFAGLTTAHKALEDFNDQGDGGHQAVLDLFDRYLREAA